ncbi:MAG: galactosyltransferase-related protein [Methanobacteriaceae archaeon]|nr:galactosyltransferase-related protein [Methanobacteriaceae archaeon]
MKNISIILPYKSDNGQHDINFNYVFNRLKEDFPKGEIIVGEDSPGNSSFNRSRAINSGVKKSSNDIIMIHDVDIILPKENVKQGINSLKTYPMIFPFWHFWHLPKTLSHKIIAGMKFDYHKLLEYNLQEVHPGGTNGGGAQIIMKDAFNSIGGYDERFVGWGWEDVLFNFKMKEKYKPDGESDWGKWLPNKNLFHLWHPPAPKNMGNKDLYDKLIEEYYK